MTELVKFAHIYTIHSNVILLFNSGKGGKILGSKAFKLVHCFKNHVQAYLFLKSRYCGSSRVCSPKNGTFSLQIVTLDSYQKLTPVDPHVKNAEHSLQIHFNKSAEHSLSGFSMRDAVKYPGLAAWFAGIETRNVQP